LSVLAAGTERRKFRIMGTSVRMIERHYGTLLHGSGDASRGKLDAYLATVEKEEEDAGADARA
jgi:hypothetical protein